MFNGANARCLSRFTDKDAHTGASARTRSYDLVHAIRKRRFKWLGHILRMPGQRLIKLAVRVQHSQGIQGDMFMDIPGNPSFEAISKLAQNRKIWRRMSCRLDNKHAMLRYARIYLNASVSPDMSPRTRRRTRRHPATPMTPSTPTAPNTNETPVSEACMARRYRARDAHEAFFRPNARAPRTNKRTEVKRNLFNKKQQSLTNKQRQARAHAHYIINHGSSSDAARFLCSERVKSIPPDTFNEIYRMCVNESASTTISPPVKPTSSAPSTTPCPPSRTDITVTTTAEAKIASPQLPTPTILGHHYLSPITHCSHSHTPPIILSLSPITSSHVNVYHHTFKDPHHITLLNDTYLYTRDPT